MSTPIVIGVTGHRELRERDIPRLRELVRAELTKLKTEYPYSPFVMLSSLAAGADLLCAEVAIELGITLKCPLPMELDQYRLDFDAEALANFDAMLAQAEEVFVAPATEPPPEEMSRNFYYRQAGIYVTTHSHVLLALWDGSPAKPDGCGTAEAVDFMLNGSYKSDCNEFRAANDGGVIHISTPRLGNESEVLISAKLLENESGRLCKVLHMTDRFNADAKAR